MSLLLDSSTPVMICSVQNVKNNHVTIYNDETLIKINENDFNAMVMYYLTNTDLRPNDSRFVLLKKIADLKEVEGYNPGGKRLSSNSTKPKKQFGPCALGLTQGA